VANEVEIVVTSKDQTNIDGIGRNVTRKWGKVGEDSGRSFSRGLSGSFTRTATTVFGHIAENATGIFSRAFGTATSTNPIIGGAITAAVMAGVAVGMPLVGAAAAGLFVLAFGGGLAGIGLAFALQNENVKKQFSELGSYFKARMSVISAPFEDAWRTIAGKARLTFEGFTPALELAFVSLSGTISTFSGRVSDALLKLEPTIGPITGAFNTILTKIGDRLPGWFEKVAGSITKVANSVNENPDVFVGLIGAAFSLTVNLLDLVAAMNDLAGELRPLAPLLKASTGGMVLFALAIQGVTGQLKMVKSVWGGIKGLFTGKHVAQIVANISGFTRPLQSAYASARGWARTKWTAALNGEYGGVIRAIAQSIARGAAWAKRKFTAGLSASLTDVYQALSDAAAAGRSWANRVFTATFNVRNVISTVSPLGAILGGKAAGGITHGAEGGPRSNLTLVGENGPELAQLPTGTRINPASNTQQMLSGRGNQPVVINFGSLSADPIGRAIMEWLRKQIKIEGGNVQIVMGP